MSLMGHRRKQHYAAIFNSVENSSCDQAHSEFCNTNITFDNGMTVDLFEMKAGIDALASNNSPAGLDGLSTEHFKFAHSRLSSLMSTLVSSIVVHGRRLLLARDTGPRNCFYVCSGQRPFSTN